LATLIVILHKYRRHTSGDKTMALSEIVDLSTKRRNVQQLKKNAKRQAELAKAA
jgi:hypothetical protein